MNEKTPNRRQKSGFYSRGFTTFALAAAALVIAASGIALYVTPRGRVANWTQWTLAGLEKEQWAALHMTAAALFLVALGVHLFFNWKVLLGYIRLRRVPGLRLKREMAAALVVGVLLVFGTLSGIPPMSDIVDLREDLKNSWESTGVRAPSGHTENSRGMGRLSLDDYVSESGLSMETVLENLRERGIPADASTPLRQVADSLNVRPGQLAHLLSGEPTGSVSGSEGAYCTSPEPAVR